MVSRSSQARQEKPSETLQVSNHTQQTSSANTNPAYLGAVKILVFFEQLICLLDCHFIIAIIKIICVRRTYTELQQTTGPFGESTSNFITRYVLSGWQCKTHFPCTITTKPNIQETCHFAARVFISSHSHKQAFVITPRSSLHQQKSCTIERVVLQ